VLEQVHATLALDVEQVVVPLGRRVLIMADLWLTDQDCPTSSASAQELVNRLDTATGPHLVIIAGNLFGATMNPVDLVKRHAAVFNTLRTFTSSLDHSVFLLVGEHDRIALSAPEVAKALSDSGVLLAAALDLTLQTTKGEECVRVGVAQPESSLNPQSREIASFRDVERLEDPSRLESFVTSRVLYRQLGKWLVVPPILAVLLILAVSVSPLFSSLERIVRYSQGATHVFTRARSEPWSTRLAFFVAVVAITEIIVGLTARGIARRLIARELAALSEHPNHADLIIDGQTLGDFGRSLSAAGYRGLIVGGKLSPVLRHRDDGFLAVVGGTTEVVEARQSHLGLPTVYVNVRQIAFVELETGYQLSVRLHAGWADQKGAVAFERLAVKEPIVKGYKTTAEITTHVVASWPSGGTWPDADDPAKRRRRTRNVRRAVAASIFATGVLDILVALAPPLRGRLTSLAQFLPLSVAQTAGAFVALTGIILMMLARGVLRGQWRPWIGAVLLLGISSLLHVVHAVSFGAVLLSTAVLILALTEWRSFRGETDRTSTASGFVTLVFGGLAALLTAFVVTEATNVHKPLPGVGTVLGALLERFAGITTISLPDRVNDWVAPVLTSVGITLVIAFLYLLTRPVVDRRHLQARSAARATDLERARDIVARHGRGTLDYFALRDDKQFFFTQDSLVAYAVFGGICIASPDPIGPAVERRRAIEDFWAFADSKGWGVGVVGAAEEWLPLYLAAGMRSIYIGDEAVVDVTNFSLAGNKMKGLRQAVSRVERLGYTVEFVDPASASSDAIQELIPLLTSSRHGDEEKGFSMMLGRMFNHDDEGLLLTVVRDEHQKPVALCQFVPSSAISGYSLDCMRRDRGEHPNGLLDFALCKTISHLAEHGGTGLSLNFAVLRSALAADGDITLTQRIERWVLLKLSGVLQIESLWKFNAKYEPTWQPRYIVYDSPEQFLPSVVSFLRAESVSDVPVVGRFIKSKHRSQTIVLGKGAQEQD